MKKSDAPKILNDEWVINLRQNGEAQENPDPDPCENCPEAQGDWHLKGVYDADGRKIDTKDAHVFMIGFDEHGNIVNKRYKMETQDGKLVYIPVD